MKRVRRAPVTTVRSRLDITGVVQGVGFRPAVARIADAHGVGGFVYNDSGSVRCEFEGAPAAVEAAVAELRDAPPPMARIDALRVTAIAPSGAAGFAIVASSSTGSARTLIPPDVATCADCLREMTDPADRRHQHPFITCTNCGPRYTVITDLPYDRPATTMAGFAMCARCADEYRDPRDRRFHAQTIACPDCGPRLTWVGPGDGRDPIAAAAALIESGGIVAVKGIGGYHLACRADDDAVLARLRRRKSRPAKPFAVMARDLSAARCLGEVDAAAARLLTSPAAPIVLVPRKDGALSGLVAPGLLDLGVMLAYAPIHHLLFGRLGAISGMVMTSANAGGSPIAFRDEHLSWIAGLADGALVHDRPIHVPCEDSVLTVDDRGAVVPLRRSRGYAPLPVSVPGLTAGAAPEILATGGDVKTTFCLMADDGRAHLSPHLGDMSDPRTQQSFTEALDHLVRMTGRRPALLACDLHPGYATTRWAQRRGQPFTQVQHHHAHAVALLAEHGRLDDPMLAVTYDGTGYGTDGTVWGGEFLALTEPSRFTRVGHLRPFALPGGEGAVRQPARIALDLLARAGIAWSDDLASVAAVGAAGRHVLAQQIPRGLGCVPTTSMGRLYDAVSSLLGVCQEVTYEGQAAIELEHLARSGGGDATEVAFEVRDGVLDPVRVISGLVDGLRAGVPTADLAAAFHDAVIAATVAVAAERARATGIPTIGLTGGVFTNRRLLSGVREGLQHLGFEVLIHHVVPCNDGGLALGQAVVAATRRRFFDEGSG
ncbi:carbamoyltransferase HypF [Mycolicibacterium sp. 050158]|uniref:carbamoyltransferase HypF n=1 Tax=Mycolicibacterium sp. 050158 TaxID=3090602 RepID=UPI00299E53C4|nr:carbamoyltransferase HypF [Mycolicibacterium sp. 050158]MDX1890558.1 carbamoyltransferase HypF [Mycolicibacterium sp. 050158]